MEITLSEPQEYFVKQAVREGRYSSETEVVNLGLRMLEEHDRKLAALRAKIQNSLQDPREVSDEEMDAALESKTQELLAKGIPW